MAEITGNFEVYAGEVLGFDNEWTLLTEDGSITVHGGGTARNITLSEHTFLSVEYDDENHFYSIADGVDLTQGILNLYGGNAYNVKWTPFESSGLISILDGRSELTFSSEIYGAYYGRNHWVPGESNYSELFQHDVSLSGLVLESVYNPDGSGYSDGVCVMNEGELSDSFVLGGTVSVYAGGLARGITLGDEDNVGHISVFGGSLEKTTVKSGGIFLLLDSSTVNDTLIATCEFSSAELSSCQGGVFNGVTVTSGSRLHTYTSDDFGGDFIDVTIEEGAEAVFYLQRVIGLTMTGHAVVEVTDGILTGSITVTESNPDEGYWCVLTESTLDFDISGITPGEAEPRVNNLSWIEIGSNVSYSLTVSDMQENGVYNLAGGAEGFDQIITIFNTSGLSDTLAVGGSVVLDGVNYALNLDSDLLTLTVSGGAPVVSGTAGDLNMDGRADIIMTIDQASHPADGSTGAWLILGDQTAAWGDLSTRGSGWEIFGTGRTVAGKNTDDVYVRSESNIIGAWTTGDDGKVTGWETVGEFSSDTRIVGLGDFNADGQTDLLLRNNNGAVGCFFTSEEKHGWNYFQSIGDEWKLSAVGDFNGDGRDDVVLKHDAGFAGCWLTQEDDTMAWADLDTLPDGFEIVGAGDFNGDGTDDVLLKNGNYYGAWLVNNGNAAGWMGLGDLGDVTVEQIADFNGDGVDDLRIRTSAGDIGAQLVMAEDTLDWHYYGAVGEEWKTGLAALG